MTSSSNRAGKAAARVDWTAELGGNVLISGGQGVGKTVLARRIKAGIESKEPGRRVEIVELSDGEPITTPDGIKKLCAECDTVIFVSESAFPEVLKPVKIRKHIRLSEFPAVLSQDRSDPRRARQALLDDYRRRMREIDRLIEPLMEEKQAVKQQLVETISRFKVDDVIRWGSGNRGGATGKGRVLEVSSWIDEVLMWKVQVIRKNGSHGAIRWIRDYNEPQLCVGP